MLGLPTGSSNVPDWVEKPLDLAQFQVEAMLPHVLYQELLPRSIERGFRPSRDWTSGFYPGLLWLLYSHTGDTHWQHYAEKVTVFLADQQYNTGEQILKSLSSPEYLAEPGENGNFILKKGAGNYLGGSEVNGPLIYADYYFIEGLLRYLKLKNGQQLYPDN